MYNKRKLTDNQLNAYTNFLEFVRLRGRYPSLRELENVWSMRSRQSVQYMVDQLVKKSKLIKLSPGKYKPIDPSAVHSLTLEDYISMTEELLVFLRNKL